jgi:predicted ATP-dependent endonuclease of OLD family
MRPLLARAFFMNEQKLPVSEIEVKIPDNDNPVLNFKVDFSQRQLTIITGPNGSGKSAVLKKIKEMHGGTTILYNPKRNSLRKAFVQAVNDVDRGNRRKNNLLSELSQGWNDTNSLPYPSFQETVVAEFRELLDDPDPKETFESMLHRISDEYSVLLKEIFPEYKAIGWKIEKGGLVFKIEKYGKYVVNAEELSTGEQEILSLVFSVNSIKDNCKILLIDEPEQHLNWSLERNLFNYLKKFSRSFNKQVIVATHSRVIFENRFKNNCIYLYFDKNKNIAVSPTAPENIRKQIAGDAVKLLVTSKNTNVIYLEDDFQERVINKLTQLLKISKKVTPIIAVDKKTVTNLYKTSIQNPNSPAFKNAYFLVDGDNKPDKYPDDNRYIHLGKNRCIETYFLDFKCLKNISNRNINEIKKTFCYLVNKIKDEKSKENLLYKGEIKENDLKPELIKKFNPKKILQPLIRYLGFENEDDFIEKYIQYVIKNKSRLRRIFDEKLIRFLWES